MHSAQRLTDELQLDTGIKEYAVVSMGCAVTVGCSNEVHRAQLHKRAVIWHSTEVLVSTPTWEFASLRDQGTAVIKSQQLPHTALKHIKAETCNLATKPPCMKQLIYSVLP